MATTTAHMAAATTVAAITAVEETTAATTEATKTSAQTLPPDVLRTGILMITHAPLSQVHRLTEVATRDQAPSLLATATTAPVEIMAMATLVLVEATTDLVAI